MAYHIFLLDKLVPSGVLLKKNYFYSLKSVVGKGFATSIAAKNCIPSFRYFFNIYIKMTAVM